MKSCASAALVAMAAAAMPKAGASAAREKCVASHAMPRSSILILRGGGFLSNVLGGGTPVGGSKNAQAEYDAAVAKAEQDLDEVAASFPTREGWGMLGRSCWFFWGAEGLIQIPLSPSHYLTISLSPSSLPIFLILFHIFPPSLLFISSHLRRGFATNHAHRHILNSSYHSPVSRRLWPATTRRPLLCASTD